MNIAHREQEQTERRECPICHAAARGILRTASVDLFRCDACGHTVASHAASQPEWRDYHDQYGADFAEALERTRRRQARRIVDALRDSEVNDHVVDFGCGRGWFLEECRQAGMHHIAGLDTSAVAISLLRAKGIEAHTLPIPEAETWQIPASAVSFRPAVLTFLDVVEHFPAAQAQSMFATIVRAFQPGLRWIVVKVPVSTGILYGLALGAARLRATGPLHQLYQLGTFPPHQQYFSPRSLQLLLSNAGFSPVRTFGDADFDIAGFESRVGVLRKLPAVFGRTAGLGLWSAALVTRQFDSLVAVARVSDRTASSP